MMSTCPECLGSGEVGDGGGNTMMCKSCEGKGIRYVQKISHPVGGMLVRDFESGAIRSADATRDDPEAYLSPLVIDRFNEYMTKHRHLPDGRIRDGDNWQKGMPLATYMKGLWRHFLHLWSRHRGHPVRDSQAGAGIEEDLCAILFNVQGYLHETIKKRLSSTTPPQ